MNGSNRMSIPWTQCPAYKDAWTDLLPSKYKPFAQLKKCFMLFISFLLPPATSFWFRYISVYIEDSSSKPIRRIKPRIPTIFSLNQETARRLGLVTFDQLRSIDHEMENTVPIAIVLSSSYLSLNSMIAAR